MNKYIELKEAQTYLESQGDPVAASMLKNVPAADVIKPIYCYQCIHFRPIGDSKTLAKCAEPGISIIINPNYFCGSAIEKKN